MSGAVTTAGRVTRREICGCGVEFGQTYIAKTQEHDSSWVPLCCRECENDLRIQQQAAEQLAAQVAEVEAEAVRRVAADTGRAERIREAANRDLMEEAAKMMAEFCVKHPPEWEAYHDKLDWNRVVAEIAAEKKGQMFEQLKKGR